jgi:putative Holliday junction resolvase
MRTLGIDPGSKRIGLALSDELGMIAQPLDYIPAEPFDGFVRRLLELIGEREIGSIIVGMPRNMDGSFGPAAEKSKELVEKLKELTGVPVRAWDERLTTAQANRILIAGNVSRKKRKEKVDKMAAAILLQSYLDSQSL